MFGGVAVDTRKHAAAKSNVGVDDGRYLIALRITEVALDERRLCGWRVHEQPRDAPRYDSQNSRLKRGTLPRDDVGRAHKCADTTSP
jgi:hypothetical protein